jgi:hypothetical protein
MGFWNVNFRLHPKLGEHIRGNVTKHGWRSTSTVFGWVTLNFKRLRLQRLTIDWPGPGSISRTFGGRARRNRTRR